MNSNPITKTTTRVETVFVGEWPTINELRAALGQMEAEGAPLDKPIRMRSADGATARRHRVPIDQRYGFTNILLVVAWE